MILMTRIKVVSRKDYSSSKEFEEVLQDSIDELENDNPDYEVSLIRLSDNELIIMAQVYYDEDNEDEEDENDGESSIYQDKSPFYDPSSESILKSYRRVNDMVNSKLRKGEF